AVSRFRAPEPAALSAECCLGGAVVGVVDGSVEVYGAYKLSSSAARRWRCGVGPSRSASEAEELRTCCCCCCCLRCSSAKRCATFQPCSSSTIRNNSWSEQPAA